jgi:muramidase (phage lysozyme)
MENQKAFLDTISFSEGTFGKGDNGYNVIVGGTFFYGYQDHPRMMVTLRSGLRSTAAGRYQLLARYFDDYKKLLDLPDFSPLCQDTIALQQIKESLALSDVQAGNFDNAIHKCAHIWASFPGAGYGQPEHSIDTLRDFYVGQGGIVANALPQPDVSV